MTPLEEIEMVVLRLSEKEGMRLTDRLQGTLPAPDACEPEEILAEAERRDAELAGGKTKPLTEAQFISGVRRRRA